MLARNYHTLVGVVLVVACKKSQSETRNTMAAQPGTRTQVEVVVLGVANANQED